MRLHDHGDLLRTVVSVAFGPGEDEHAAACAGLLRGYFRGRNDIQKDVTEAVTVHWKTLTSFVKEQVESGEELPLPLLGATVGRVAEIKKRRK
jgi:hypothetical protein